MRLKLLIIFTPFLFSCSAILVKNSRVNLITESSSDRIEVEGISSRTVLNKNEDKTYTLNNNEKGYVISTYRKKYRKKSRVVRPTKFNYLKIIDILIPVVADVLLFTNDYGKLNGPIFMVGVFGWAGPIFGPWKTYEKAFKLPEPTTLPQRIDGGPYIQAIDYSVTIPKQNQSSFVYRNYDDFLSKTNSIKKPIKDSLFLKNYSFDDNAIKLLDGFNLRDTSKTYFLNRLSDLKLVVKIKSLEENNLFSVQQVNAKIELNLLNNFNQTSIITKEVMASSNWNRYYIHQRGLNSIQRSDLVEDALAKFLINEEVKEVLGNYTAKETVNGNISNEVLIPKENNVVTTLTEAVKAVVTVITKDAYGSGCVISKNGYIITNSHVIANNDNSILVQLNDSTKHKATLIVANLTEDLALIKIDTTLKNLFGIDKSLPIEIGQEVYAIGASNIDDYSMSVSKGIISTKRKVDGTTFIQTDCSINRGNSGGALINKDGKLYGIITAKMIGNGIEGVGFAIPYSNLEKALKIKFE